MAAGMGNFFVHLFDMFVARLPGVRGVYSAVKQVSDFVFTEREMTFHANRRRRISAQGHLVDGLCDRRESGVDSRHRGEPIVAVLIPYSPLPVTGCAITVRKSECIDLNITFDQACQFIVSCGVVVPASQVWTTEKGPGVRDQGPGQETRRLGVWETGRHAAQNRLQFCKELLSRLAMLFVRRSSIFNLQSYFSGP